MVEHPLLPLGLCGNTVFVQDLPLPHNLQHFHTCNMMATRDVPEVKPAAALFDAAVFGATVQLPAFDKVEPEIWFSVADANFVLRKVSDSTTKYYYVLSKRDAATLRKLSAFLKRLRSADPYQEIRSKPCRTYEPPLEQKIDTLLATKDMGDERPMEFTLKLQHLAADATMDDVLKRIFLRSIPQSIETAITVNCATKFEDLAEVADNAWTSAAATAAEATASVPAITGAQPSTPRCGRVGCQCGGRAPGQMKTLTLFNFHQRFSDAAKNVHRSALAGARIINATRCRSSTWKKLLTERTNKMTQPPETHRTVAERGRSTETRQARPDHGPPLEEVMPVGHRLPGQPLAPVLDNPPASKNIQSNV